MAGIFNLFGDSTQVAKVPTVFGSDGSSSNSIQRIKNIGAPGATPGKIFGQKSRGLSIRSTSELNIHPLSPRSLELKKHAIQGEKFTLKPLETLGKPRSPIKHKSPIKLSSQNQFKTLSPKLVVSTNEKTELTEKPEEFVFKKPHTPRKLKKADMDYPEPEVLAPFCENELDLYNDAYLNYLRTCKGPFSSPDEDEGFLSEEDFELIPIVQEEVQSRESRFEDMELPLPDLDSLSDLGVSDEE